MNCPTCHETLENGQRFCIHCGANVEALLIPEPPAGPLAGAPPTVPLRLDAPTPAEPPNVFAAVEPAPAPVAPGRIDQPEFAIIEQTLMPTAAPTGPNPAHRVVHPPPAPASPVPLQGPPTAVVARPPTSLLAVPPRRNGASIVLAVFAGVAGVAALVGVFVPMLRLRTDAPIPDAGSYTVNDLFLGTNLLMAFVVAAACMIGGGTLALLGKRIGAGLAAGAALTLTPVVLSMFASADVISKRGETNAINVAAAGGGGTFFQSRLEAGLWILVGAAAVGLVVFVVALLQSGNEHRPPLNVFIGVFGALAAMLAAAGQMIPGDFTTFADNFNASIASRTETYSRLALIALVAITGAVGFLSNRRWGIGLALGGAAIWTWQWLSSLAGLGQTPAPPGFVAFGSNGDLKPHLVTTIGVVAVLVLAALALLTPRRQN